VTDAGYTTRTLDARLTSGGFDLGNTRSAGFDWYIQRWYGGAVHDTGGYIFNADGSVTFDGASALSASPVGTTDWVGTAYGGGGYFEAELKFDPAEVADAINGGATSWPSWWSISLESQINSTLGAGWSGVPAKALWVSQQGATPGFAHFIEVDFMEYSSTTQSKNYLKTLHDWSGVYTTEWPVNILQGGSENSKFAGGGVDYTQYNRFGFLWVPATDATKGELTYFFNGRQMGSTIRYRKYSDADDAPPVTSASPFLFGIIDDQHLTLQIGSPAGAPMTVRSVKVWQSDASGNLSQ